MEQEKDEELQELLRGESALKLKEFTLPQPHRFTVTVQEVPYDLMSQER